MQKSKHAESTWDLEHKTNNNNNSQRKSANELESIEARNKTSHTVHHSEVVVSEDYELLAKSSQVNKSDIILLLLQSNERTLLISARSLSLYIIRMDENSPLVHFVFLWGEYVWME